MTSLAASGCRDGICRRRPVGRAATSYTKPANPVVINSGMLNSLPFSRTTNGRAAGASHAAEPRITMSEQIKNVSDASFDADVIKSSQPVLVDYWAAWCGPCKMIAPILEEVASEYSGRLTVAKLNVDENQGTAAKYGIRGIPTLMLFKDGQAAATKVGALSKSQLTAFLDGAL
ncbi:thioredoxin [Bordetella petrii]|uniref:Thioredoxin n=2 Tax=Bordetella petrii TaxID=94624 RepID=A9IJX8_BORPD|nr:thioredoxin [Bordetella petrii]